MQRLELQFYAFFMVVLSGITLGVLFDLLRAVRGYLRPNRWVAAVGDLLFWGAAVLVLAGGLFFGNWGQFRIYVLVGTLLGLGVYYWLASSTVLALADFVLHVIAWLVDLVWTLVLKLIWSPLVFVANLLIAAARILWGWTRALLEGVWGALSLLSEWLVGSLVRPCRCVKLRYLLVKRRVRRILRRWSLRLGRPDRK